MLSLLPLLNKTLDELTDDDVLGLLAKFAPQTEYTPEMKTEIVAALKSDDVNKVSDVLARPDLIQKLVVFVQPKSAAPSGVVKRCGHCGKFNMIHFETE